MVNVNVKDEVYQAIQEYNLVIARPIHQNLTDSERIGIFYNTLKRHVCIASGRGMDKIAVKHLDCTFKDNGEIETVELKKFYRPNPWDSVPEEYDTVVTNLKKIFDGR